MGQPSVTPLLNRSNLRINANETTSTARGLAISNTHRLVSPPFYSDTLAIRMNLEHLSFEGWQLSIRIDFQQFFVITLFERTDPDTPFGAHPLTGYL